jgi:hypothetical protein
VTIPLSPATLFPGLPSDLRDELVAAFRSIETNFREERWEPSELNGGKLCEVAYTIVSGYLAGAYPPSAHKPSNMVDACRALEKAHATAPRSFRIQIPRMITALYEIRNNRGVGHIGGDVNPNLMDAVCVLQLSKWIVAELIRVLHQISTQAAQAAVDALSQREIPLVWSVNGKHRVLDNSLSMREKTLLLLYRTPKGMSETDLLRSLEHSNPSVYRRDVLRKAHDDRLLEYDDTTRTAQISPLGSRFVELKVLTR